ncbi:MAG TPA: c-type cytochrome [Gemmatimonadales bacterium]|nr:c-type cytochrome [Gemmatimonadales bacterium]
MRGFAQLDWWTGGLMLAVATAVGLAGACGGDGPTTPSAETLASGKQIFRFDTFGDETFWTDTLGMNAVVEGVPPTTALAVGLKVDADTLPPAVLQAIQAGQVDLNDPATTVTLLKLGAVVGVRATVDSTNHVTRFGVTCALCHSTVDNRVAPGIGSRLDGWPNLDLNPGAIIALSPALTAAQKAVYNSWGPGRYDARYNFDGLNGPTVIPPAYGLAGVHSVTFTGDGNELAYWNRYVAVTQMHGHGTFDEPRLGIRVRNPPDSVSDKLAALQAYQLSIAAPAPPAGSFDGAAAQRGKAVFDGAGQCATCHSGTLRTDANSRLHPPADVVSEPEPNGEPSAAARSATKQYRTTPLRALWQHAPYFHNGTAATLADVVERYDAVRHLGLTPQQKQDLVEYLKSF